ncbi:MAG: iron-sulfur cluster carrier protein ApbC [Cellvibrionales bacterium TMED148]|nr:iron-sulfur cluster carrier protein ApbC [Porticoccaceae bacterium]RPG91774.1 MAG: iron-sulfur cluster carrier protein ApbC [Cellvibrionales bacterium TMED148]
MLDNVKSIVAVASGKGGVGKSTVAVNLALAMHLEGLKIGLLDADIYGPSIAMMLGVSDNDRPKSTDGQTILPLTAHGLSTMSIGYLVDSQTPMVWRGPMASGALKQMLQQTDWGPLDVLIVDMPPGTGDIQLTLSQTAQLTGVVIVTTPQDIALLDAKRGIEMFAKVEIPVLGIIENMSAMQCSVCGNFEPVFGSGGGERIAQSYETKLLGQLPLDKRIREHGDIGTPIVLGHSKTPAAQSYISIARSLTERLSSKGIGASPDIIFD